MKERAVQLIVWGLLFVLIDLKIVTFDIIHDLIGYIFIYKGIQKLPLSRWLGYAKISAVFLGILSVIEIFGLGYINLNELNQDFTIRLGAAGVLAILSLFFHINLLSGLLDSVDENYLKGQYSSLQKFKRFYLIFSLINIMSLPALMIFQEDLVFYLIILIAAGFIIEIVFIVKISSIKRFIPFKERAS
ncbi:hypothetical protein D3H55_18575 [Bacillus salacetis]|uniref:Uncharacterized protein n=1 Tax=Bacillus salacetis TaxID=2315464 RepID=A0A3A1QR16_9BACI|nr:hypothetical protein [Bacillus salacetis]RIW29604.1 hypothetical protein D3H55_18575 [Bacillus salacetis]